MRWQKVKLADILIRRRDPIKVLSSEEYKLVTIKLYHKGLTLRSVVKGFELKSPMSRIKVGDFILSGIDARNGAFGIVPEELDGAIVTNDFWCLDPDENRLNKDFLLFLSTTSFFDNICKQSSDGTTQRIRLQKDKFFNYSIFLPSIEDQVTLTKQLKKIEFDGFAIKKELLDQLSLVKQLRQSFLSEAMQSTLYHSELVEGEETGQQLLARIKAEKEQLNNGKKLKKEKELPPIKPTEIPFEIPKDWVWSRLFYICDAIIDCPHSTPKYIDTETDYFAIDTNCIDDKGTLTRLRGLSKQGFEDRTKRIIPQAKDIIYAREGSIGRATFVPEKINICLGQRVMLFRASKIVLPKFLKFIVTEYYYKERLLSKHKGMGAKHVNVKDIVQSLVVLPPLSIQTQIVAKLDELIKTCDDLENSIRQSQLRNDQLLQQVLKEALESRMNKEFLTD
jgi:type I restriction enzyme S subunit